jgi:toxin ParE1/3/4
MAEFHLSPEAESELDDSWLYLARASGSAEIASRVVDDIAERFWLLARHPYLGRQRDDDLRPGLRSLVSGEYVIFYRVESEDVLILHILHGHRDIAGFLG